MWLLAAFGSALFAGLTSILAKCGIRKTDSDIATALRTGIVLLFAWLMVFLRGSAATVCELSVRTWLFLILSGLATGASWLCYFRALQRGNISEVVAIDKSGMVLTILLAFLFFHETVTIVKGCAVIGIALGTFLMLEYKKTKASQKSRKGWLIYALLSTVFASLTSILGKIGMEGVESNLGTAIRTAVVLLMAWCIVLMQKKLSLIHAIPHGELGFLLLSGIATGASWLCYYYALQNGPASAVVPIDKLSILVTIVFSYFVFHEKLSRRACIGLCFIVAGTLALALL